MIDISLISAETPLLDEKTAETMRGVFQKLEKAVVLKAVVDLKEEKSAQMASFLKGIAGLSPKLSLELYSPEESGILSAQTREQGTEIDVSHLPVTGIFVDGLYQRAAFHGSAGRKGNQLLCYWNLQCGRAWAGDFQGCHKKDWKAEAASRCEDLCFSGLPSLPWRGDCQSADCHVKSPGSGSDVRCQFVSGFGGSLSD